MPNEIEPNGINPEPLDGQLATEGCKDTVAYFIDIRRTEEEGRVVMDFKGAVHASKTMIPITPEQADKIDFEELWGEEGWLLYDTDDYDEIRAEILRRIAIQYN